MGELLKAVNDDLTENGFHLTEIRSTLQLLTRRENASRSRSEVEYDVSWACTPTECFLVKGRILLSGVQIFRTRKSLHEPDIKEVEYVISKTVPCSDFFVLDFIQVFDLVV